MDLFNTESILNILPCDGIADYYGRIIAPEEAKARLEQLLRTIAWKNDEAIIFGKHIVTKRMAAWYGDSSFSYTYSGTTKQALVWTQELLELKALVKKTSGATFNSCLLNLYHSGEEGMAWHSDNERSLGKNTVIASLSFGAERKFSMKHKTNKQTVSIILESGSLLVMQGRTQAHWLHSLPKSKKITTPRVNLTFRTIVL